MEADEGRSTGRALRCLSALAATGIATVLVAGLSMPAASAASVDPLRALVPKRPYPALAECRGSAGAPAPAPVEEPPPPPPPPPASAAPSVRVEPSATPTPTRSRARTPTPTPTPTPRRVAPVAPFALRINSGGRAVVDGGRSWVADRHFVGGQSFRTSERVRSTTPDVDASERWGLRGYSIPVPNNRTYRVRVHLTELTQPPGYRIVDILLEGKVVARGVEAYALAGGRNRTKVLGFTTTVRDGTLDLRLRPSAGAKHGAPSVTGLEVLSRP